MDCAKAWEEGGAQRSYGTVYSIVHTDCWSKLPLELDENDHWGAATDAPLWPDESRSVETVKCTGSQLGFS